MTDFPAPTTPAIPAPPARNKPLWKKKKFFIPVGTVAALLAIGALVPAPQDEADVVIAASTETEVEIAEAPVVGEAPVETVAPQPVQAPAATSAPVEQAEPQAALMPDVIGMNLQDAQDLIQTHGVFFSLSEDASGQGRNQWIDSNWYVVAQNIEPGQPIDEFDVVLSVLKYTD